MNSKKLFAGAVALAMAAAIVPSAGQAATAEELAAQIAQLQAQLASLMGQLGGTTGTTGTTSSTAPAACAGISFTRNLTLGSQGTDVQCLQALLNQDPATQVAASGVGSAGNESQYFGGLTKAAVVAFQNKYATEILAPVGLTAGTGFVGASTRAKLNAMLVGGTTGTTGGTTGTTGTTLPEGCTSTAGYSPVTGESCSSTSTSTGTGLTMTGQEGSITVSMNPTPANFVKVYEGDEKVAVYALKVKATGSDVDVQRVTLRFGSQPWSTMTNVYLYDGDTQIASSALNSTTVSKVSSSDYQITLAGFTSKVIVPVNTDKILTVKVDVLPGVSSSLLGNVNVGTPSATAVRAVDQAGLNQYGGLDNAAAWTTGNYRTFSVNASQAANATLTVSRNTNSPLSRNIVADSNGEIKDATLLTFNLKATKDDLLLDQIKNVAFTTGSNYVDPTTVYLVDDAGTTIGTATPASNKVDFTELNYKIAKDTTKTFSIKVDQTSVTTGKTMKVTVIGNATNIVAEKSNGALVTGTSVSGSAASNDAYVYTVGPEMALSSQSTTQQNDGTSDQTGTSTVTTVFNIQVTAKGGDVYLPTTGAFGILANNTSAVTQISYTKPSGADDYTATSTTTWYKVSQDETVTFAVNAAYGTTTAGYFYLNVSSVAWSLTPATADGEPVTGDTSTYMVSDWKGDTKYLP